VLCILTEVLINEYRIVSYLKQKGIEKTIINVPQDRSNRCANVSAQKVKGQGFYTSGIPFLVELGQ